MRYVPRLDVVDTPVGRGRPPTLRRSLLDARGRSPGWRSRKRLGTLERVPLLLKSSMMTSSPPLAGMLSLVLRRSAGRVRGSLSAEAAARRCCFRASASCARLGSRREEPFAAFRWHGGGANEHRRLLPRQFDSLPPPYPPPPADAYYRRPQTYSRLASLRQIRLVCKRDFF